MTLVDPNIAADPPMPHRDHVGAGVSESASVAPVPAVHEPPAAPAAPESVAAPAAPAAPEPAVPAMPESILGGFEEPKPGEAPPEVVPEAAPEPVALDPIAYEFQLPDGFEAASEKMESFKSLLSESRVPPEKAQKLLDMYIEEKRQEQEASVRKQWEAFGQTQAEWQRQVKADPEIGGAGHETALKAIRRMRDTFVTQSDRAGFTEFLNMTGAGSHPAFLRFLYRVSRRFDEPAPPPPNPKPPPNIGVAPGKKGIRSLYDHSTNSQQR